MPEVPVIPEGSVVAGQIVDDLGDSNTLSRAAWTKVCNRILAAVKLGKVNPGTFTVTCGTPGAVVPITPGTSGTIT